MRRIGLLLALLAASMTSNADYNANMAGVLTMVATYADADSIYIRLNNQPSTHPACNASYFVIATDVPLERRKAMLANLLAARSTGEAINIGYDAVGSCAEGYIRVHRVG